MDLLLYDSTFKGLLTAIFEVYEYRKADPFIQKDEAAAGSLFGQHQIVASDDEKSRRVWQKLDQKIAKNSMRQLYKAFLSEIPGIENTILRYVQYVLLSKNSVDHDFSHPDVLMVQQTSRKVDREKHRMEAFVRFELTKDQLYYSIIQPDYNVLPLICDHFKKRYADQRWMIYDSRRKYGLYYDLQEVSEIQVNFTADLNNNDEKKAIYDEGEVLYQQLWKQYFSSVNIVARKNTKLHIQHMPKRYWRYLTEKK